MRTAEKLRAIETNQDERERQSEMFEDRVGQRFLAYHEAHPETLVALVSVVRAYAAAGGTPRGMSFFFEVLRYRSAIDGTDAAGFKLNDNYTSRYARMIEDFYPDLRGYFRKRKLTSRIGWEA